MSKLTAQERNAIVDSHDDVDMVSYGEMGWCILFTDGKEAMPGDDIADLERAITAARDGRVFVVETFALFGGWSNCWTVDDQPETFSTQDAAALDLFEFAKDMRESGMDFDSKMYRIREVT